MQPTLAVQKQDGEQAGHKDRQKREDDAGNECEKVEANALLGDNGEAYKEGEQEKAILLQLAQKEDKELAIRSTQITQQQEWLNAELEAQNAINEIIAKRDFQATPEGRNA